MMAKKRKFSSDMIVGLLIIGAVVIAIYGYVFLREIPVRQKALNIYISFTDVTGLTKGDAITVSGMKVGRVRSMRLQPGYVLVDASLNGDIPFPKDSRASIKSIGMIGEKYIDLQLGHAGEMLQNGDIIPGNYIADIADMGGPVSEIINRVNNLFEKLNNAMDTAFAEKAQRDLAQTLHNSRVISDHTREIVEAGIDNIKNMLASLDTLTSCMKRYWLTNNADISRATQNLANASGDIQQTVTKLDSVLSVTQLLLADIEQQRGSAGKLVRSDELYARLNDTIDQAQTLLDDVKKNPGKYLQVSVIHF